MIDRAGKLKRRLRIMALVFYASAPVQAWGSCISAVDLLAQNGRFEEEPCNVFDALYIHNNIVKIDYTGYPLPDEAGAVGLAVQMFVFRRENLDTKDGIVDHLIAAVPDLKTLDEERYQAYSAYIMFNYGYHANDSQDRTGALNPALISAMQGTRFESLNEIICFVELDVPSVPIDQVVISSRYMHQCQTPAG
ncbi:MAG: hypothetical protein ACK41U_12200 [Paracoccus sp. (in: a-proteobacteria)]|uniref:hypothetical protein n=1 Tax=Paracoccus sp. TaxID=267 RepID=UPI00391D3153